MKECLRGHTNPPRYKHGECKPCSKLRKLGEYQKRKKSIIGYLTNRQITAKDEAILYKGGKCIDCGFDDLSRPEVFDFDHLPGTEKVANFVRMKCLSRERREAELDKCELVCANCHRTRTRRRALAQHESVT